MRLEQAGQGAGAVDTTGVPMTFADIAFLTLGLVLFFLLASVEVTD